jgi:hypothetical protein
MKVGTYPVLKRSNGIKTEAYEVLKRINNGEDNFDSPYTNKSKAEFSLMKVDEETLLKDLTQEEKIELADKSNSFPLLYLWNSVYIYVLNQWVLVYKGNNYNSNLSYCPSAIRINDNYLLLTEDYSLWKLTTPPLA